MKHAPPTSAPRQAAEPPGAEDGQLGRCRAGEQVGGGDGVLELGLVHPRLALDDEPAQHGDVRGGPPKPVQPMRPHSRPPCRGRCRDGRRAVGSSGVVRHAPCWHARIGRPGTRSEQSRATPRRSRRCGRRRSRRPACMVLRERWLAPASRHRRACSANGVVVADAVLDAPLEAEAGHVASDLGCALADDLERRLRDPRRDGRGGTSRRPPAPPAAARPGRRRRSRSGWAAAAGAVRAPRLDVVEAPVERDALLGPQRPEHGDLLLEDGGCAGRRGRRARRTRTCSSRSRARAGSGRRTAGRPRPPAWPSSAVWRWGPMRMEVAKARSVQPAR